MNLFHRLYNKTSLFLLFIVILLNVGLSVEAEAVRPPLQPLNSKNFQQMINDAEMIAIGTVISLTSSKTLQPPLETVTIHVTVKPERILKGNGAMEPIEIEESYQRFSKEDQGCSSGGGPAVGKKVTAHVAGPTPQVGRYEDGARMLMFLTSIAGSTKFQPLGSGNHDAYLGVFQITARGVRSDRHRFDENLSRQTQSEPELIDLILSVTGGRK